MRRWAEAVAAEPGQGIRLRALPLLQARRTDRRQHAGARFDATAPENAFAHHGERPDPVRFFVGNADSYGYFAFHAAQ